MKLTYIGIPGFNGDPHRVLDRGACPVLAGNPLGNWKNFKQGDGSSWNLDQSRAHTKANEIEKIDAASSVVSHDPAGNLTKSPRPGNWSGTFDYTWDAWNRLVAVTARGTNIAFAYDGEHKRITKTASSITRHFYYSIDWQILEERLDEETEPLRQYVWNPNPDRMDDLVLRDEGAGGSGSSSSGTQQRLYALNDLMNVTAIVDDDGSVVERYGYTPFGESRVMDAGFGPRSSSDYDWELRYKTYPLDLESGLYQVRHRYLHPGLGRWMSRDPIGERGGMNLYAFVGNDPVNRWDYLGLQYSNPQEDWWHIDNPNPKPPKNSPPPEGVVDCGERIEKEAQRKGNPFGGASDPSGRWLHCVVSCRISRECFGGRFTAWIAGDWVQDPWWKDPETTTSDPGDRAANKVGRDASCKKKKSCEESCNEAFHNGSLYPPPPPPTPSPPPTSPPWPPRYIPN